MLSFDEAALVRVMIQDALHSISIESHDSVDRAQPVPITFAGEDAVPLHHVVISYLCV